MILIIVLYFIQIFIVFCKFINNSKQRYFKTKKELISSLIPFYYLTFITNGLKERWNQLN